VLKNGTVPPALPFIALRRFLPASELRRGLLFGVLLVLPANPLILSNAQALGIRLLFAGLCPLYGVTLALVVARLGRVGAVPPTAAT
jgi:hypothetical protein